ncbi:unnamed protein product [Effrenium voratum]|nr:unnamed protein product [Effrenium voratum]
MGCGASKKVLPELGEADLRGLTQEQKAAVYACPNTPRSVKTQIIKTRSERSGVLSESDCDFDLAGEEILQEAQQALENGDKQTYKPLNVIWSHPDSGGRLFVSNAHAASSRDVLREHGIRFIVNCLDFNGELGTFHNDPQVSYLYFPIGCWREAAPEKTPRSVARVLAPMLGFVGRNLEEGSNVMIHCLAGRIRETGVFEGAAPNTFSANEKAEGA